MKKKEKEILERLAENCNLLREKNLHLLIRGEYLASLEAKPKKTGHPNRVKAEEVRPVIARLKEEIDNLQKEINADFDLLLSV